MDKKRRAITIVMDLADWELALIVPSANVHVEIYNAQYSGVMATGEITQVTDLDRCPDVPHTGHASSD